MLAFLVHGSRHDEFLQEVFEIQFPVFPVRHVHLVLEGNPLRTSKHTDDDIASPLLDFHGFPPQIIGGKNLFSRQRHKPSLESYAQEIAPVILKGNDPPIAASTAPENGSSFTMASNVPTEA